MRFRFVEENRDKIPVKRLCTIMNVSSRGYRASRSRPISQSPTFGHLMPCRAATQRYGIAGAYQGTTSLGSGKLWPPEDDRRAEGAWF